MRLSSIILVILYSYILFEFAFCSLMLTHDALKTFKAPDTVHVQLDDATEQAMASLEASAKRHAEQDEERRLMQPVKNCPPLTNLSPRQQIQRVNDILGAAPADLQKLDKR